MTCHFCSRKGNEATIRIPGVKGTVMIFKGEICDKDAKLLGRVKNADKS